MASLNTSREFLYDLDLNNMNSVNFSIGFALWNFTSYPWNKHNSSSVGDIFLLTHIRVVFCLLYGLVCATCVFGNSLVIFVILTHKKMRNITNFFLANLAVADLCVGLFCVIPTLVSYITPVWKFGMIMCKLYYFVQCASYTASIVILTVIALERYFAIIHPMLSKRFSRMCLMRIIVAIVWLIAIVYALPLLISYGTVHVTPLGGGNETEKVTFCISKLHLDNRIYVLANLSLGYLLPLTLMAVMYAKIAIFLWRSSNLYGDKTKNGAVSFRRRPPATNRLLAEREYPGDTTSLTNITGSTYLSEYSGAMKAPRGRLPFVFLSRVDLDEAGRRRSACPGPQRGSRETLKKRNTESMLGIDQAANNSLLHPHDCLTTVVNGKRRKSLGPTALPRSYSQPNDLHTVPCLQPRPMNQALSQQLLEQKRRGSRPSICSRASRLSAQFDFRSLSITSLGRLDSFSFACTKGEKTKINNPLWTRRKVIRLLIVIVVTFGLCVLPHHVRLLWQEWAGHQSYTKHHRLVPPITFLFFYLNNCLNPILYAFLSDNFRKALKDLKRSVRSRRKHAHDAQSSRVASMRTKT